MTRNGLLTTLGALLTSAGLAAEAPEFTSAPAPQAPVTSAPDKAAPDAGSNPANGYDPNNPYYPGWPTPDMYGGQCVQPAGLQFYGDVIPPPPPNQPFIFFGIDYLHYQMRKAPTAPMLTISDSPADRATIGNPTTSILFGQNKTEFGPFRGMHYFAELVLGCQVSLEVGGYLFEQRSQTVSATTEESNETLGIPFIDPFTLLPNANIIGSPGSLTGEATVQHTFRVYGEEFNFVLQPGGYDENDQFHTRLLLGVRYDEMRETLRLHDQFITLNDNSIFQSQLVPAGTTITGADAFDTRNTFFGGQIGLEWEWRCGNFFVRAIPKFGVGVIHQNLTISGSSNALLLDGTQITGNGDFLALPTNIGTIKRDEFGILPEITGLIGVEVSDHLELHAGYDYTYWSSIVRPGDAIDQQVNINQLAPAFNTGVQAGPARPFPIFHSAPFYMQGIVAGGTFRW
jgi:hypothetical protein